MRTVSEMVGSLIIRFYPKREVEGVRVIFSDLGVDRAECASRIRSAFEALNTIGRGYQATAKRIGYIVVWPGHYTFADGFGGVHLASADLLGISNYALASVFVHESTHLRISARGIKYLPECRERIERLCVKEQARFLRHVPDHGEEMARDAESVLAFPWWTQEANDADLRKLFDDNNLPKWLMAITRRRSRQ